MARVELSGGGPLAFTDEYFDEYADKVLSEFQEHEHLVTLVDQRTIIQSSIDASRKKLKRLGEKLNTMEELQNIA